LPQSADNQLFVGLKTICHSFRPAKVDELDHLTKKKGNCFKLWREPHNQRLDMEAAGEIGFAV